MGLSITAVYARLPPISIFTTQEPPLTAAFLVNIAYSIMLSRTLALSRYLIVLAVVGSLVAALALLLYGVVELAIILWETIITGAVSSKGAKALALTFIEIVDLFLLSTVFYIIALGLYELFIDDTIDVPRWLEIHTLDDLKNKLTGVVVVVMSVLFLGQVVTWDGQRDLMGFGLGVAAVIAALTYFLSQQHGKKPKGKTNGDTNEQ